MPTATTLAITNYNLITCCITVFQIWKTIVDQAEQPVAY